MSIAALRVKPRTEKRKRLYSHGFEAIDKRTYAGREARAWRALALQQKGGASCPFHIRHEIELCAYDVWLLYELGEEIARDAKKRRTVINKRYKTLPKLHDQFDKVSARFERRREALQLDKGGLDLARRLMVEGK
jgi:hypothetical protein